MTYNATVHGPVAGYATVDGRRVAVSSKRSSRNREVLFQLPFQDLVTGRVTGPRSFVSSFAVSPFTFNAGYVDDENIAMRSTGQLPVRSRQVNPGLPTKGTGEFEWRGTSPAQNPRDINPKSGMLINWNNKSARNFPAADDNWAYGTVQRVEMLERALGRRDRQSLTSVVAAMNMAATQDVRVIEVVPTIAELLEGSRAPSRRARQMLDMLLAWRAVGGSRLDRNLDGLIDNPGAAIMDASWPKIADAVMRPVLDDQLDQLNTLIAIDSPPPGGFFDGWYSYVKHDLRKLMHHGRGVHFCGHGNMRACQRSIWAAIEAAGNQLAVTQGPNPAAWRQNANNERITFAPGILSTTIRWTNRPSGIQQVLSFGGER